MSDESPTADKPKLQLLTTDETAQFLRLKQRTIRWYVKIGKLHPLRLGKHMRFRQDEVEALITQDPR